MTMIGGKIRGKIGHQRNGIYTAPHFHAVSPTLFCGQKPYVFFTYLCFSCSIRRLVEKLSPGIIRYETTARRQNSLDGPAESCPWPTITVSKQATKYLIAIWPYKKILDDTLECDSTTFTGSACYTYT